MHKLLVLPKEYVVNRHFKKAFLKEADKIIPELNRIEHNLIDDIFSENNIPYDELYKYYLKQWNTYIGWVKRNNKAQHCVINEHYLEQGYKPIN